MTTLHLLLTLALAGIFAASGALKLRDLEGTWLAVNNFGVTNGKIAGWIARLLPIGELLLAAGLVVTSGWLFTTVAVLALAVMLGFTILVGVTLAKGRAPACHCFGAASTEPISVTTLYRNIGFSVLALLVVLRTGFPGFFPALVGADRWGAAWVVTTAAAAALITVLAVRLRALSRAHAALEAEAVELRQRPATVLRDIPDVVVYDKAGTEQTLGELVTEKASLIIGVSPTCEHCKELVPLLPVLRKQLRDEVELRVLTWSDWEAGAETYPDIAEYLIASPNGDAFHSLDLGGTPSAALLGANGKVLAGPARGADEIGELFTAVMQAIGVNVITGASHKVQEAAAKGFGGGDSGEAHLPETGTEVGDVLVADEEGTERPLVAALSAVTNGSTDIPVVAWRNGCPFCDQIAGEMVQFSARGEVVLLINEDISTVREQGFTGPALRIVDTDTADASYSLGVPGTPAGYPVIDGHVGEGGGVGGGSVLRMLIDRARAKGTYEPTPMLVQMEAQQANERGDAERVAALTEEFRERFPELAHDIAVQQAHGQRGHIGHDHGHGHAHGHDHDHADHGAADGAGEVVSGELVETDTK